MKSSPATRLIALILAIAVISGACSSSDTTETREPLFDVVSTAEPAAPDAAPPTTKVAATTPEPTAAPEPAENSLETDIEAAVAALLPPGSPGVIARYDVQGSTLLEKAIGVESFETGRPLTPSHAFRLASTTKPITAATVLRLHERGVLDIDDSIADFLPSDLTERLHVIDGVSRGEEITIRHLLTHTSGLADRPFDTPFVDEVGADPARVWKPRELVEYTIDNSTPVFLPGEAFSYSDDGYVLLGMVIEAATGEELHAVYRTEVLDPLGMDETYLEGHEAARGSNMSHAYIDGVDALTIDPSTDWGGGGLVSTVGDLTTFGKALNRRALFAEPETHDLMVTDAGHGYGMGLYVVALGGGPIALAHDGFWGSLVITVPESDIVIAATMNQFVDDETRDEFAFGLLRLLDVVLRSQQPQRPDGIEQVEVGDRTVAYKTGGTGTPTVVFESGFGDGLESWVDITGPVSSFAKTFTYDRAGYGDSELAGTPRDGAHVVDDLRAALSASGHEPPYILVGHSLGGMYAQLFARTHADEVVGLVLVDATPGGYFEQCLEEVGPEFCGPNDLDAMPEPFRSEAEGISVTEQQLEEAPALAGTPAIVLASSKSDDFVPTDAIWIAAQQDQATELSASLTITSESGHYIHHDEPDLVIEAIYSVVSANKS